MKFEEDWEEVEFNPEYMLLKSLRYMLDQKSYPKRNTRKFLKMAYRLVSRGEISEDDLNEFIENEGVNKKIAEEYKKKKDKPQKGGDVGWEDDCGSGFGGYGRSSC